MTNCSFSSLFSKCIIQISPLPSFFQFLRNCPKVFQLEQTHTPIKHSSAQSVHLKRTSFTSHSFLILKWPTKYINKSHLHSLPIRMGIEVARVLAVTVGVFVIVASTSWRKVCQASWVYNGRRPIPVALTEFIGLDAACSTYFPGRPSEKDKRRVKASRTARVKRGCTLLLPAQQLAPL